MKFRNAHPGVIFKNQYLRSRYEPYSPSKPYRLFELAEKTGISRQYWGDVFAGRKAVTAKLAIHMGQVSKESATHWAVLQAEYNVMVELQKKKFRR